MSIDRPRTSLITSAVTILRGRLKHSWLENEILNKTPQAVKLLRDGPGWPALATFQANAAQALDLANNIAGGFSPSTLVDGSGPLSTLSVDERRTIKDAVHRAYLQVFDANVLAAELRIAATAMHSALNDFINVWSVRAGNDSVTTLREKWISVLVAAATLRDKLDALPNRIVLP